MLNMLCFVYWGRVNTEQSAHWLAAVDWQELTWSWAARQHWRYDDNMTTHDDMTLMFGHNNIIKADIKYTSY